MVEEPSARTSFTPSLGDALILGLSQAAVVSIAAASLSIVFRPQKRLFDQPLTEDGFYSFAVASNIAHGRGITIDGEMWTNGFQPLFTALTVPGFWLAGDDQWLAIRTVLFLHWLVYLATAFVLGSVGAQAAQASRDDPRSSAWCIAAAYLLSLNLLMHHFNGLETGLLLLMYAVTWRSYQSLRMDSAPALFGFGAILGLLVLTRIDGAFFVATLCFYLVVRRDGASLERRILRTLPIGLAALLVSSPWWAYNYLEFGSIMPISGQAQRGSGMESWRLTWSAAGLSEALMPWIYGGLGLGLMSLLRFVAAAIALVLLSRATRFQRGAGAERADKDRCQLSRTAEFALCLGFSYALLVTYYTFFTTANNFYDRYFTPISLLVVFGSGTILTRAGRRASAVYAVGMGALLLGMLVALGLMRTDLLFTGNQYYRDQLSLVRASVPDQEWVAAGQTGTLGFFRGRVVNLDGKVNGEALGFWNHMWDYLRQRGITWFCDWKGYAAPYLGEPPESHGWHKVAERGGFALYRYDASSEGARESAGRSTSEHPAGEDDRTGVGRGGDLHSHIEE